MPPMRNGIYFPDTEPSNAQQPWVQFDEDQTPDMTDAFAAFKSRLTRPSDMSHGAAPHSMSGPTLDMPHADMPMDAGAHENLAPKAGGANGGGFKSLG